MDISDTLMYVYEMLGAELLSNLYDKLGRHLMDPQQSAVWQVTFSASEGPNVKNVLSLCSIIIKLFYLHFVSLLKEKTNSKKKKKFFLRDIEKNNNKHPIREFNSFFSRHTILKAKLSQKYPAANLRCSDEFVCSQHLISDT